MILTAVDSGRLTWVASHSGKIAATNITTGGGSKTLAAALDQLRLTHGGTDTLTRDGSNVLYA
jgi:hypothetical protein